MTVICVGNALRGDDAAGLEVAKALRGRLPDGVRLLEREGEPTALLAAFEETESLVLVDTVCAGAEPGTVHRLDAGAAPLPAQLARASTHHFSLGETIELARALGKLPRRTVVLGIEGASFGIGAPLSPAVQRAVGDAVERVLEEVA